MNLSPACQKILNTWLSGNWASTLPNDRQELDRFIEQYESDHGFTLDERLFLKEICRVVGINMIDDARAAIGVIVEALYVRRDAASERTMSLDVKQRSLEAELDAMVEAGRPREEIAAKAKEYTAVYRACTEEALKCVRSFTNGK